MRKVLNVVHPYTFVDGHYIPIGKGAARKNLAHLVKAALQNNIEVLCYLHPSEDKIDKSIGFLENPKIRRYCTTDAGEPTEDNEEEIRRFLKSLIKSLLGDLKIRKSVRFCAYFSMGWICCTVCLLGPSCTFQQHMDSHLGFLLQVRRVLHIL